MSLPTTPGMYAGQRKTRWELDADGAWWFRGYEDGAHPTPTQQDRTPSDVLNYGMPLTPLSPGRGGGVMQAEVTVRVVLTDEVGRHVATVKRTIRKDAGGNPRFFVSEVMPAAEGNIEEAILSALRTWDREAARQQESE